METNTPQPHWGRSEKYHPRERHLYALIFSGRRCYVGQTINTKNRWRQHAKLWPEGFETVELETAHATKAQAEELEYAWRLVAMREGWRVLSAPYVQIRPANRATRERRALARARRWPKDKRSWWRRLLSYFAEAV